MRLHYVLTLAVATVSACNAARIVDNIPLAEDSKPIDSTYIHRLLLSSDNDELTQPKFIEHKLQKSLKNPSKTKKLYQYWQKHGYTAKEVASDLGQNENRELDPTYKTLSKGYAAYLKEQSE